MPAKRASRSPARPPWATPRRGTPRGQVAPLRIESAALRNQRTIWLYTPPGYSSAGAPYDLLLLFDGADYREQIAAPNILDNLIAAGSIAPPVLALIDSLDQATRERELPCHPPTLEFLADELLPWLAARYHLAGTPARRLIGGASYGGLAAAYAGLMRPELFGNVLAQSGSFWWRPPDDPEYEWLTRQFVERPALPLRFYLDVGRQEARARVRPNQLIACRHLRDVLRAKGYRVEYAETNGKHEPLAWRATLADGLVALLGTRPAD